MLDIKFIRENAALVRKATKNKGLEPKDVDKVLALDKARRELKSKIDDLRSQRNKISSKFKGKEIRLLHLYNIKIGRSGKKAEFTSEGNKDIPKINWVSDFVKVGEVYDNTVKKFGRVDVVINGAHVERALKNLGPTISLIKI